MKFKLYTLVDITNTGARRGAGLPYHQEQNYMTVLQTVSIRANPSNVKITKETISLASTPFGKSFKGKHAVWCMSFDIEYEDAHSVETLIADFDLVPFIKELEETVKFDRSIFISEKSDHTNIFFELVDK